LEPITDVDLINDLPLLLGGVSSLLRCMGGDPDVQPGHRPGLCLMAQQVDFAVWILNRWYKKKEAGEHAPKANQTS
jgi:hypothetical protein